MLPPDTRVIVYLHRTGLFGYIIGTVPGQTEDGSNNFSDHTSQGSGIGLKREGYYKDFLQVLLDEGAARDFSGHAPLDQTIFDWGKLTELGGGIHVDPFMFYLRQDEMCGIWGYYFDQLLRIAGNNLIVNSGCVTEEHRDDEGEGTYYRGETPYPWELMGAYEYGATTYRETDDADVHHKKSEGKFEPAEDKQTPFHRYEEYGGYLGQGRIRQVQLPPKDATSADVNKMEPENDPGVVVFREHVGLDGSYALAASKQAVFARRGVLPAPKRIRPADSYHAEADSAENDNYKRAGQHGGEDAHEVGDITREDGELTQLLPTVAVLDMHAHAFNWKAIHAFHYHVGDYELKQESDLDGAQQHVPDFGSLSSAFWLPDPESQSHKVDHRYGNAKFYEVLQHLTFTENGGVVLQGGQGEEIRMSHGNIQISAPGNILVQSGKSAVTLAGDDAIIRAYNSADITANNKDVRIKAEKNMLLLSGNGGSGGTLIENRASGTDQDFPSEGGEAVTAAGVIVKADSSTFTTLSKEVYIRTGNPASVQSGPIILDASKGTGTNGEIRMIGKDYYRFITGTAYDAYGNAPNFQNVNRSNRSYNLVSSELRVNGMIYGDMGCRVLSDVVSVDGTFYSSNGGHLNKLRNSGQVRNTIRTKIDDVHDETKDSVDQFYDSKFEQTLYTPETALGNEEGQRKASFGMRSEEEYCTSSFMLPKNHWQLLAEEAGSGTSTWGENVVKYQAASGGGGKETMPWPGLKKWRDEETLLSVAHTMYDSENNVAKDRGGDDNPYSEATYGEFSKSKPQSGYAIISC